MSNRRLALEAGVPAVPFPPQRAPMPVLGLFRRWIEARRTSRELALLSPRLREDAGLPAAIVAPNALLDIAAGRFHR